MDKNVNNGVEVEGGVIRAFLRATVGREGAVEFAEDAPHGMELAVQSQLGTVADAQPDPELKRLTVLMIKIFLEKDEAKKQVSIQGATELAVSNEISVEDISEIWEAMQKPVLAEEEVNLVQLVVTNELKKLA